MDNYANLNDNELISLVRERNEEASEILYHKYSPLINKICSKYYKYVKDKGIEYVDMHQECLVAFEEALNSYNLRDDVTFYTFVNVCIERKLFTELRHAGRDKYKFLNEAIPLETIDDNASNNLIDYIEDNKNNPEFGLISQMEYQELYDKIVGVLTNFEECVFNLKLQNFDYREIASILDKDTKSIDNAIQRIKTKIRGIVNE